jgi:hypothetical protein
MAEDRVIDTVEELEQLDELETTQPQPQQQVAVQAMQAPCTIYLTDDNVFQVTEQYAWGHTPHGVFASGNWIDDTEERDLLIPSTSISRIELFFPEDNA